MCLISQRICESDGVSPNLHSRAGCVSFSDAGVYFLLFSQLALSRGMCHPFLQLDRVYKCLPTCTLARDVSPSGIPAQAATASPNLHSRAGCVGRFLCCPRVPIAPNLHSRAGCVLCYDSLRPGGRTPNLHSRAGCVCPGLRPLWQWQWLPTCTLARDVSITLPRFPQY